jgi:hypothetical protein
MTLEEVLAVVGSRCRGPLGVGPSGSQPDEPPLTTNVVDHQPASYGVLQATGALSHSAQVQQQQDQSTPIQPNLPPIVSNFGPPPLQLGQDSLQFLLGTVAQVHPDALEAHFDTNATIVHRITECVAHMDHHLRTSLQTQIEQYCSMLLEMGVNNALFLAWSECQRLVVSRCLAVLHPDKPFLRRDVLMMFYCALLHRAFPLVAAARVIAVCCCLLFGRCLWVLWWLCGRVLVWWWLFFLFVWFGAAVGQGAVQGPQIC